MVAIGKPKVLMLKARLDAKYVTFLAIQSQNPIYESNVKAQFAIVESTQWRFDEQK